MTFWMYCGNNINNIEFICDDAKNVKIKDLDVVVVEETTEFLG